jgi:short-subunit dehydrogenase
MEVYVIMGYNRKIFITGASSGLGEQFVNISKNNGIDIHYHQRNNDLNVNVFGDINNKETRDNIVKYVIDNDINVFINNAGIYQNKSLQDTNIDDIYNILHTNLYSKIILTKMVLDVFIEKGYGMIYNINSLAGLKGSKNESVYSASKHGLKGFTESIKEEIREYKDIRIVNVILGAFKTKMTIGRSNYDILGDTKEVADCILNHINQDYKTINNDLIITRK